jgi:regulator of sigma E protease
MITSILYIALALLGLSFLIFIHELGHYWMARRVGMRVETFSIGFGKPIVSWQYQGVKWQIGWIIFGGFVKIAGQEAEENQDPYEVADGFFGKTPWQRMQVALAGPLMNILFGIVLFTILWGFGGREKNFSEFTSVIGWVDPKSELYAQGVRPGDEIVAYGDHAYQGFKDHIYAPMTVGSESIGVKINKVDYLNDKKELIQTTVKTYPHPAVLSEKGILSAGITQSGSYILYNSLPKGRPNPLPENSPLANSGIEIGDRIVWVDGEPIFSLYQLNKILNDDRVLLTIEREGKTLLRRVPRVPVVELKLDAAFREELVDWQYEAGLNSRKLLSLYTIPYNLTNDLVVENQMPFLDKENEDEAFPPHPYSDNEKPLQVGDRIVAINGKRLSHSSQLLEDIQARRATIIVEKGEDFSKSIRWNEADVDFEKRVNWKDLNSIVASLGTDQPVAASGNLKLLKTVTPKKRVELEFTPDVEMLYKAQKEKIEQIEDPEMRAQALAMLENQENQLLLGLPNVQDRKVQYNPSPLELFWNVVTEIQRTLTALLTGTLNPKWMSGPIGIVQVVHDNSMVSIKEALFWIGVISLNLGVINLLPIPVLDGGTIVFCLFEMITRKRIKPKVMEKMIIPFALLLIGFFIFLTYNDLLRIFQSFVK